LPDRDRLPQLSAERPFVTDGGLETTLIFHRGLVLPDFAAFVLLQDATGRQALHDYYLPYLAIAREQGVGIVLDTPTWRANPDWATRLGYSPAELDQANRQAVALLEDIRAGEPSGGAPIVISGAIGPQGDGYSPVETMSAQEAERYHAVQIESFRRTAADLVTAFTITYADEAIGIVRAAGAAGMPVVIGFTVETDGRLPDGTRLRDAIEEVDAATDAAAAYFMVNCAHPTHFADVLEEDGPWLERIGAIRANASTRSHAELDEAEDLDEGDPVQLGADHRALRRRLPRVRVLGGCCGTDHRHVAEVLTAWGA
jgi:S-methylmethionine-dependent homocysteine/selenocysteine methylase